MNDGRRLELQRWAAHLRLLQMELQRWAAHRVNDGCRDGSCRDGCCRAGTSHCSPSRTKQSGTKKAIGDESNRLRTDTMIRGGDAPVPWKKAPWKRGLKEYIRTTDHTNTTGRRNTTNNRLLRSGETTGVLGLPPLESQHPPGAVSGKPYKEAENIRDK